MEECHIRKNLKSTKSNGLGHKNCTLLFRITQCFIAVLEMVTQVKSKNDSTKTFWCELLIVH